MSIMKVCKKFSSIIAGAAYCEQWQQGQHGAQQGSSDSDTGLQFSSEGRLPQRHAVRHPQEGSGGPHARCGECR